MRLLSIAISASLLIGSSAQARDHADMSTIRDQCTARGGTSSQCDCVAQETHARFTEAELALISIAADPNLSREARSEALQASGADPAALSSLTRQMVTSEPAIQQSCGVGLMRNPRG